jgi:hypothetical protein
MPSTAHSNCVTEIGIVSRQHSIDLLAATTVLDNCVPDPSLMDWGTIDGYSVYLPIGDWAKCKSDLYHQKVLDSVGILMRQYFNGLCNAYHRALVDSGVNPESLERWTKQVADGTHTITKWISHLTMYCRTEAGPVFVPYPFSGFMCTSQNLQP